MMYESPIMAMVKDITTEMQKEQDREIMNAIQSVGISVDKDELVKALHYDRQQYDKGYSEGYADAKSDDLRPVGKWIALEPEIGLYGCSRCEHMILRAECNYCPNCGAKMEVTADA